MPNVCVVSVKCLFLFQDADFERYLAPLRSQSFVHFHSHSESGCTRDGCVPVDLDRDDIAVLEIMTKSVWKDTIALVLFKSLCTNITSLLHHCTSPSVFSVVRMFLSMKQMSY